MGRSGSIPETCTFFADIAQLGERQTEDLKVPGSIPGVGTCLSFIKVDTGKIAVAWHWTSISLW